MMILTDEEYKGLVLEVSNRIKNLAYMMAEDRVKEMLDIVGGIDVLNNVGADSSVSFTFTVTLIGNDFREIVGGLRRNGIS